MAKKSFWQPIFTDSRVFCKDCRHYDIYSYIGLGCRYRKEIYEYDNAVGDYVWVKDVQLDFREQNKNNDCPYFKPKRKLFKRT